MVSDGRSEPRSRTTTADCFSSHSPMSRWFHSPPRGSAARLRQVLPCNLLVLIESRTLCCRRSRETIREIPEMWPEGHQVFVFPEIQSDSAPAMSTGQSSARSARGFRMEPSEPLSGALAVGSRPFGSGYPAPHRGNAQPGGGGLDGRPPPSAASRGRFRCPSRARGLRAARTDGPSRRASPRVSPAQRRA